MYVHTGVCIICVDTCMHMSLCMYEYMYVHSHIYMYAYSVCMYMHMHVYVCAVYTLADSCIPGAEEGSHIRGAK